MTKEYGGYLDTGLVFSTFKEYRTRKLIIINLFKKLSTKDAYIYQWYIFSRPLLSEKQKEFIWNELNRYACLEEEWKSC